MSTLEVLFQHKTRGKSLAAASTKELNLPSAVEFARAVTLELIIEVLWFSSGAASTEGLDVPSAVEFARADTLELMIFEVLGFSLKYKMFRSSSKVQGWKSLF